MKKMTTGGVTQWIVVMLLLPLVVSIPTSVCHAEPQYKSRLWKVKSLLHTSYLFGTMHVSDKQVLYIPPQLQSVIENANTLALETVLGSKSLQQMQQAFVLQDGQTLRSIVGESLYRKVNVAFARRGYGLLNVNAFKPWAVSLLLNYPPPTGIEVLDKKLHSLFEAGGKNIVGLESIEEQTQYFDRMHVDDQVAFLSASLDQLSDMDASMRQMKRLYLRGDLSALHDFSVAQVLAVENLQVKNLMKDLIDTRNELMVRRALPLLAKGNALIAVGALHLPGEKGIISSLRKKGYQVTPIYID